MFDVYLLALVNFAICSGIVVIAFCRLNAMHTTVLQRVRSEYAVYLTGGICAALQPWWGEWPQWGSIAIAGALLFGLGCSSYAWHDGPPVTAEKGAA